jgi:uncharacterized RDD family membrane protein YckC
MTALGGAISDPTKVTGARIGAYLVDVVIGTAATFLLLGLFGGSTWTTYEGRFDPVSVCEVVNGASAGGRNPLPAEVEGATACIAWGDTAYLFTDEQAARLQAVTTLGWAIFGVANLVVLPTFAGGSLGKLLFGLRIVTGDGRRAGIGRNLLRWVVLFVDAFCCGIVGLVAMRSSRGHRRLGDMAAGTFVVHRSWEGRPLQIPGLITVRSSHEFGGWGPAPVQAPPGLGEGGGIDAPVWDPSRSAYVRYDQTSGVWFQWDDAQQAWVPAQT